MRTLPLLVGILIALSGYLGYVVVTQKIPCVTPITYGVGMYDDKIGVSQDEAERLMRGAAAAWNSALEREVFVESSSPELPVNFVYGSLQQTLDTRDAISDDIEQAKEEQKSVANRYAALKKQYEQALRQGRATPAMKAELDSLLEQYYELQDIVSADIAKGNALSYDDIEAGQYILDRDGTRIFVYGFENTTELKSTLLHEFGHALGLGHVDDVRAVMYRSDKSVATTLGPADLAELERACSEQKTLLSGILNS